MIRIMEIKNWKTTNKFLNHDLLKPAAILPFMARYLNCDFLRVYLPGFGIESVPCPNLANNKDHFLELIDRVLFTFFKLII